MLTATGQGLTAVTFEVSNEGNAECRHPVIASAQRQLAAYFAGDLTAFDVPIATHGTPFEEAVWALVRSIPYGRTASYGDLAGMLGKPGSARAVGRANGSNPVPIFTPCHRVVGAHGALTGYRGGIERKAFLLRLESAQAQLFSS